MPHVPPLWPAWLCSRSDRGNYWDGWNPHISHTTASHQEYRLYGRPPCRLALYGSNVYQPLIAAIGSRVANCHTVFLVDRGTRDLVTLGMPIYVQILHKSSFLRTPSSRLKAKAFCKFVSPSALFRKSGSPYTGLYSPFFIPECSLPTDLKGLT